MPIKQNYVTAEIVAGKIQNAMTHLHLYVENW